MSAAEQAGGVETVSALLEGGGAAAAFVAPEDGTTITHGQLAAHVDTLARRLAGAGVGRGDRVALALGNSPDLVELLLAIMVLGAAAAPLNPAYTADELSFYLGDIRPKLLLLPEQQPAARAAASAAGVRTATVKGAPGQPPEVHLEGRVLEAEAGFEPGGPDDVAIVLHTSGTTSRPKQVPLRQANLMASVRTIAAHYRLGPDDVSFCVMPLFHVHGLVASTFSALAAGGRVVVPRRFTPQRFWPQAREQGATWLSAGPTLHQMILDHADGEGPPTSLRFARSCSSALSPALLARAEGIYRVPVLEAYGMTEASHQMTSNPLPPGERRAGSVGVPTGIELAVVDAALRFLPAGEPGEVVIKGPSVTSGYAANDEANAQSFFDGWFRTGDRGVLRDGYLFLEGRLKEMILRGGENVAPAEVEEVLLRHPAVADAVCFGVADEKYGETVAAAVRLRAEADERSLIEHCRGSLAAFKVPTAIHLLEEIPRTPTGKVQRRKVAEHVQKGG